MPANAKVPAISIPVCTPDKVCVVKTSIALSPFSPVKSQVSQLPNEAAKLAAKIPA
jgi:hypothetical protein